MTDLSAFEITRRWPAQHPDRIQLYSLPTPNGVKGVNHARGDGLPYEWHLVDFAGDDQKTPEFLSLNPNGKIPAMIDPDGPGGRAAAAVRIRRDAALSRREDGPVPAGRCRRALACDPVGDVPDGGVGPMFGQLGFFHKFAGRDYEDKRPRDRYVAEAKRLLSVMDGWLAGREWFVGDEYSVADISMLGWVRNLVGFYEAAEIVGFSEYGNVADWLDRRWRACGAARIERPASSLTLAEGRARRKIARPPQLSCVPQRTDGVGGTVPPAPRNSMEQEMRKSFVAAFAAMAFAVSAAPAALPTGAPAPDFSCRARSAASR